MKSQAFTRFQFWAAVGLVLGFFLPWISIAGLISLSGYQVSDYMRQSANKTLDADKARAQEKHGLWWTPPTQKELQAQQQKETDASIQLALSYLLYLIPVFGIGCIVRELRELSLKRRYVSYCVTAFVPLLLLGGMFWQENDDGRLLEQLSIGAWLSAAAALTMLVGAITTARSLALSPSTAKQAVSVGKSV